MMTTLYSPEDLAAILGEDDVRKIWDWRKRYQWPSVKIGQRIWFTQAHLDQIIEAHTQTPAKKSDDGLPALTGLTSRSASRPRRGA